MLWVAAFAAGVMLKLHASRHVVTHSSYSHTKPTLWASGRLRWVRWLIGVGLEHDMPLPRRRLHHAQLDPHNRRAGTRCWRQRAGQAQCARGRRVPRACGRCTAPWLRWGNPRACAAALPRCRALPCSCCGIRGHGTAAVVRCGTGLAERARCLPPLSGFSWAASPPSRA